MQEAFAIAVRTWPATGVPRRPAAWITTAARRRAIDRLRAASTAQRTAATGGCAAGTRGVAGRRRRGGRRQRPRLRRSAPSRLPVLSPRARPRRAGRIDIARRRWSVDSVDRAGVPRARDDDGATARTGQAQGGSRAHSRSPCPRPRCSPDRLDAALAVVYLVFNEGYSATEGDALVRRQLCDEAIRLGRLLARPSPRRARGARAARIDAPAPLPARHPHRRERSTGTARGAGPGRWDRDAIAEGLALVEQALGQGRPGPLQVQASIAALHAEASGHGSDGLVPDRRVVRRAGPSVAVASGRVEPGCRDRDERRRRCRARRARRARPRARRLPPPACRPRRPVAPGGASCPRQSPSTTGRSQARALSPSGRTSNDAAERYRPASADARPLLGVVLGEMVDDATIDGVDEDEAAPRRVVPRPSTGGCARSAGSAALASRAVLTRGPPGNPRPSKPRPTPPSRRCRDANPR